MLDNEGSFISQAQFARLEELGSGNLFFQSTGRTLYELCKAIWERARREIAEASKLSFVGLSMHSFLEGGLRFLFSDRAANVQKDCDRSLEIVLACPGACYPGADFKKAAIPNSLADRLARTLCGIYPKIKMDDGTGRLLTPNRRMVGAGGIVCYEDFASFIQSEL